MNKIRTILIASLALAVAAPVAATADSGKGKGETKSAEAKTKKAKKAPKGKQAEFKGTVKAVDATAGTVTVTVDRPVDRADIAAAVDEAGYVLVP